MLYLANRPFRVPSHVTVPMKLRGLIYFKLSHFFAFQSKKEREKLAATWLFHSTWDFVQKKITSSLSLGQVALVFCLPTATSCSS